MKIDNCFSELKRRNVYKVQSRLLSRGPSRIKRIPQLFFSKCENGQKDQAQKILGRLNEEAKSHYVAPYALALVQIGLGDKNRAIEEFEHAYQEHQTNYLFAIKVDPMLDDLRGDPRFDALVQKVIGAKK